MAKDTGTNAGTDSLTNASGENLVSLAALLVVGSWLIFEVIAEEYFVVTVAVAIGLLILALPRLDLDAITAIAPLPAVLRFLGYFLASVGVVEIIDELQGGILDAGGASIFGALVAYAGYVLAFLGARKI